MYQFSNYKITKEEIGNNKKKYCDDGKAFNEV